MHEAESQQALRNRLLSQMVKVPGPLETECWIFQTSTGHSAFSWKGRLTSVARFAYQAFIGSIKDGYFICHKCDRGDCINPSHLFQGTPKDNAQDAVAKGRIKRGEAHATAKLTETEVSRIKALINAGISLKEIAVEAGVTNSRIWLIRAERAWAHVEPRINKSIRDWDRHLISCWHCQEEFLPKQRRSRFCSLECRYKWHRDQELAEKSVFVRTTFSNSWRRL